MNFNPLKIEAGDNTNRCLIESVRNAKDCNRGSAGNLNGLRNLLILDQCGGATEYAGEFNSLAKIEALRELRSVVGNTIKG